VEQKQQEFYCSLLHDLQGFRDAWRNHVMQTRRDYEVDEAKVVFGHVPRCLRTLSAKVSEVYIR
jgi:hypothetical protein